MVVKVSHQIFSPELVPRLENEYGILHLIYHRNRNQHRVARWWKDLDQLHRCVRKILFTVHKFEGVVKHALKRKIHLSALEIAYSMIKKRLFTRCYYSFNGIVALGQFVGLGLTLVANLSALHALITSMDGLASKLESTKLIAAEKDLAPKESYVIADDDLGEEIDQTESRRSDEGKVISPVAHLSSKTQLDDIDSIFGHTSSKKKIKKSKEKKKRKKNAIDEIFG